MFLLASCGAVLFLGSFGFIYYYKTYTRNVLECHGLLDNMSGFMRNPHYEDDEINKNCDTFWHSVIYMIFLAIAVIIYIIF